MQGKALMLRSSIQGNVPVEVNQYLMKIGARIPGIKPGYQTVDYLTKVQASTRFWGNIYEINSTPLPLKFIQTFSKSISSSSLLFKL